MGTITFAVWNSLGYGLLVLAGLIIWLHLRLRSETHWDSRCLSHLLSLCVPVLITSFIWWHFWEDIEVSGGLESGIWPQLDSLFPDCLPAWALLGTWGLSLLGVLIYVLRHWSFGYLLASCARIEPDSANRAELLAAIQQTSNELANKAGIMAPPIRHLRTHKPIAVVVGFYCPTIYLSSWYLDNLEPTQLRCVLAHELVHIERKDNLIAALTWGLAIAAFYFPPSWYSLRSLLAERELAADEMASDLSGHPLSLAQVLLKISQLALNSENLPSNIIYEPIGIEQRVESLIQLHRNGLKVHAARNQWGFAALMWLIGSLGFICTDLLPHWLHLP